ncbi:MAG: hypothetical protein ACYCX3_11595 [Thermoleophilia bacterium]
MNASSPTCFELEPSGWGLLAGIPDCPVRFRFTRHFLERLESRWPGVAPEAVLIGLPRARVLADDMHGEYTVTLESPFFAGSMMLGIYYPSWRSGSDGVAFLRTCYPTWSGRMDEAHLAIVVKRGGRLCRRRRLTEVFERRRARQSGAGLPA